FRSCARNRRADWEKTQIDAARREDRDQENWRGNNLDARMPVFLRAEDRRRQSRTESAMATRKDRERWHSINQQHRRHLEFRDARARPADARVRRRQIERCDQRPACARRRKVSSARRQDLLAQEGQLCCERSGTRGRNWWRDGRRRNRRRPFDEKYLARGRVLPAGERSSHGPRIKSPKRCKLSIRARRR